MACYISTLFAEIQVSNSIQTDRLATKCIYSGKSKSPWSVLGPSIFIPFPPRHAKAYTTCSILLTILASWSLTSRFLSSPR